MYHLLQKLCLTVCLREHISISHFLDYPYENSTQGVRIKELLLTMYIVNESYNSLQSERQALQSEPQLTEATYNIISDLSLNLSFFLLFPGFSFIVNCDS